MKNNSIYDLSIPVTSLTAEPDPPKIIYVDHSHSAEGMIEEAKKMLEKAGLPPQASAALERSLFPESMALANELISMDAHAGTHLDAPYHFGPLSGDAPALTIDRVPLEWCFADGIRLDLTGKPPGYAITAGDIQKAESNPGCSIRPGNIVLIMTGYDDYKSKGYFSSYPGMSREATLFLIDKGVRIIGIDTWGFDRPIPAMLTDYLKTRDKSVIFPAHFLGREKTYLHIEKLYNLGSLPSPSGFKVACFPVKLEKGSAGFTRVVAIFGEAA